MRISIQHDGETLTDATITRFSDIPIVLFEFSQHYGPGEFVARATSDFIEGFRCCEPVFKLTTEWLETNE